jgi:hypothetical protein
MLPGVLVTSLFHLPELADNLGECELLVVHLHRYFLKPVGCVLLAFL